MSAGDAADGRPKLFLVDGTAVAYRSYFAFIRNPLLNSRGENTSAVYGFLLSMLALIEEHQPDYLAVVFDPPPPTFRHQMFPEYKATRERMPDDMRGQLPLINELLDAMGVRHLMVKGYEADDVIGTLAGQAAGERGMEVFLVTGDKDFMQLVGPNVRMLTFGRPGENAEIIDAGRVEEKMGVPPERVIELLGLAGDTSDNVPGVPGVGPKTALKLLAEHGTIEGVLENVGSMKPGKMRQRLEENAYQARLSRELVTIKRDVPLEGLDPEDLVPAGPDEEKVRSILTRLEFTSMIDRVIPRAEEEGAGTAERDYHCVDSTAAFEMLLERFKGCTECAVDLETTSLEPMRAGIVGFSFAFREGEAFYLPLNLKAEESDLPPPEKLVEALRPHLEDPAIGKVGQNIKHDMLVLARQGVELQGLTFDTMIASYLVNPGRRSHGLDVLSLEYLGHRNIPISELIGKGKNQISFAEVPIPRATEYAAEDADMTLRLKGSFQPLLVEGGLDDLFRNMELPLVPVLTAMEREGVAVDEAALGALSESMAASLAGLEQEIHGLAGEAFNINSPKQLAGILFEKLRVHDELGIKRIKKTKSGFSTDVTVLQLLSAHPLPRKLLDFRHLAKLKNTYVDVLPTLVNPETGRIHTSFNQTVAATGRLSSSNPNLQNIPVRTATGREIRKAFIPRPGGWKMLSADYSQVELRILAHLSQDQGLLSAFADRDDVHVRTASAMFGVAPDAVTPDQRGQAKTINFGVIYGMGPVRLSREFGVSMAEARSFIDDYFTTYPGVRAWLDQSLETAKETLEVATLFGRRRPLPEIDSGDPRVRAAAENMAVNTPIQGTAADIIKRAMLAVARELESRNLQSRMIMQVHDELVFDVHPDEVEPLTTMVKDCMSGAADLSVSLVVDVGVGENWLEAH